MNNFNYKSSDGLLNINTLSPSVKYFYKVQKPEELNKSAFGSKIAFFNLNNELIYHRSRMYAHELHSKEEIELARQKVELGESDVNNTDSTLVLVKWSKEGNLAYYLEHYQWNYKVLCESVFLHLADQYSYRIDETVNEFKIVDQLQLEDRKFEENKILAQLQSLGLNKEKLIKDGISDSKWYPK
jgi:hypothetical protein